MLRSDEILTKRWKHWGNADLIAFPARGRMPRHFQAPNRLEDFLNKPATQ
jgi:hypothetical protein